MTIADQIQEVQQKINAACQRARRSPSEITVVAVAKGQPVEKINEAVAAGISDLGENYVQEMRGHRKGVEGGMRWHFVGHLQRNKVRQVLETVSLIHSLDSIELAREIDRRAERKIQEVLIELNLGNEPTKSGLIAESASDPSLQTLLDTLAGSHRVRLVGVMTLPPLQEDPERSRPFFRRLKEIRDAINRQGGYREPLTHLSMGMSHDFEVAIEEGATIVRIGRGIFGGRA